MTKISFIFSSLLLLTSYQLQASELPDLGSPDLVEYDPQTKAALGRAFSTELHTHYDLIEDPETLAYIRHIGRKLTSQTSVKQHFSFYVLNNPEINAFAGPDGVIGIHSGLILEADTEDEVAAVMAHEIAHVTQHHLSRSYDYQKGLNMGSIATLIAAILIGSQDPNAGIATFMGGTALTLQKQLKNSRQHEHEADYFGIQYLDKAGYDPHAMGDFFGKLSKAAQLDFKPPEILMTHPVTSTRLAQAEDRARQFPPFKPRPKSISLSLIKQRILMSTKNTSQNAFDILNLSPAVLCYHNTLNLLKKSTLTKMPQCLINKQNTIPTNRLVALVQAQLMIKIHPKKALKEFRYLMDIYPQDNSIVYRYAKALVKLKKIPQAQALLTQKIPNFKYQYGLYQLLAHLYSTQHNLSMAYYNNALAQVNIGNLKYALHLFKKSLTEIKEKNNPLKLKIKQFVKDLNQKIKNATITIG